jgi:hypothetical protein
MGTAVTNKNEVWKSVENKEKREIFVRKKHSASEQYMLFVMTYFVVDADQQMLTGSIMAFHVSNMEKTRNPCTVFSYKPLGKRPRARWSRSEFITFLENKLRRRN